MSQLAPLIINLTLGVVAQMGAGDTIKPANLGTGTPGNDMFLRGDGTWSNTIQGDLTIFNNLIIIGNEIEVQNDLNIDATAMIFGIIASEINLSATDTVGITGTNDVIVNSNLILLNGDLETSATVLTLSNDLGILGGVVNFNNAEVQIAPTTEFYPTGNVYIGGAGTSLTILPTAVTWSGNPTHSGNHTFSENMTFSGSAKRIAGDFSNATIANRVLFQDKTTNTITSIGAIPNGTATASSISAYASSDPDNTHYIIMVASATQTVLRSTISGTGTQRPMEFQIAGTTYMNVSTTGKVGVNAAGVVFAAVNPFEVKCATAKATAGVVGVAGFWSSDASNPFGLIMAQEGHASLASRQFHMQTQDQGVGNGGILTLNAFAGDVKVGNSAGGVTVVAPTWTWPAAVSHSGVHTFSSRVSAETVRATGSTISGDGIHMYFNASIGTITAQNAGSAYRDLRLEGLSVALLVSGTPYLSLNSSGNATFAGVVAVGGATVSTSTALIMPAGTTGVSSLRLPHGAAPTAPVNGDMWTTTAGLFVRINGATVGPLS